MSLLRLTVFAGLQILGLDAGEHAGTVVLVGVGQLAHIFNELVVLVFKVADAPGLLQDVRGKAHSVPEQEQESHDAAGQEGHQDDEVEGKLDGGHLGNGQEVQLEREFLGEHVLILEKENQAQKEEKGQNENLNVAHGGCLLTVRGSVFKVWL